MNSPSDASGRSSRKRPVSIDSCLSLFKDPVFAMAVLGIFLYDHAVQWQ